MQEPHCNKILEGGKGIRILRLVARVVKALMSTLFRRIFNFRVRLRFTRSFRVCNDTSEKFLVIDFRSSSRTFACFHRGFAFREC